MASDGRDESTGKFKPGHKLQKRRKDTKVDAWSNILTGIGNAGRDKRMVGSSFQVDPVSDLEARDLWRGDDLAARIIETVPREMFREEIEIRCEDHELSEELCDAMEELHLHHALISAKNYERAYGGAAIFPIINDGMGDLALPLNEERISQIDHFQVFEPRELYPIKYYSNPMQKKFGHPEIYQLVPLNPGGVTGPVLEIHESRLVIFPGIRVSRQVQSGTLHGWGDSVLTRVNAVLRDFQVSWQSAAVLLTDFSQGVFKMDQLNLSLSQDRDGEIQRRLLTMDSVRSSLRAIVIDKEDDFTRQATPMAGLPELLDRFAARLSAAADMPTTLLMGQSPSGMNATGESDIRFFYDRVAAVQQSDKHRIERLIKLIMLSKAGPTGGEEPDMWSIQFKPLWQATEKDQADARFVQAQTDQIYINNGVVTPDDIAKSRFGGDTYSYETTVDFEARAEYDAQMALAQQEAQKQLVASTTTEGTETNGTQGTDESKSE